MSIKNNLASHCDLGNGWIAAMWKDGGMTISHKDTREEIQLERESVELLRKIIRESEGGE